MPLAANTRLRMIADENDLQAVRTDPSGFLYAVLQVLRDPDSFGEADFAALIERGVRYAREQGGLLRSAGDVRANAPAVRGQARAQAEPVAIKPKRKARPRAQPADTIVYAGTDEEDERVAEAQRLRLTLEQPDDYEFEEEEVIAVDESAITLTNDQLQRLLRNVATEAVRGGVRGLVDQATTPQEPPPLVDDDDPVDEDDPEEEDEGEDEQTAPTPGEPVDEPATDDRGRDESGRFVTSKK